MDEPASGAAVLAGHSMGCHTAVALRARGRARRVGGPGADRPRVTLGAAAAGGGAGGLGPARRRPRAGRGGRLHRRPTRPTSTVDPEWRERVLAITRERLSRHRASARRSPRRCAQVPRSVPFDGLAALESLELPALVVASRDEADPGHPYAVAEAWAERFPARELVSEEPGESPLAWQGGQLSREIADFVDRRGEPRQPERPLAALCFPPMEIDEGHAIHYSAVTRGTPVYSSDGRRSAGSTQVVDNYREHILDGFVIETNEGNLRLRRRARGRPHRRARGDPHDRRRRRPPSCRRPRRRRRTTGPTAAAASRGMLGGSWRKH